MTEINTDSIIESGGIPQTIGKRERLEEADLARNRKNRQNRMEAIVHWCKIGIIIISVLVFVAAIICRVLHLFLPTCYRWLTDEQIGKIDEFFVHGTIGALVAGAIAKFVKLGESSEGF